MDCFHVVQNNNIFKQNQPVAHIYTDTWIDYINNWHWWSLIILNNAKLQIIMLHKSYVSEVVDPLFGHLANWHGHQTMDQTTSQC